MMKSTVATRTLIVALCLGAGALYLARTTTAESVPHRQSLSLLPMQIDGAVGRRDADFTPDILAVLGVDDYISRTYYQPGQLAVGLYVGYYYSQREGDTIHSPMNCLPGAGWTPLEQSHIPIRVRLSDGAAATTSVAVNRVIIGKGADRQLVYYWYQSRDRVVASEYWGKIYTVLDAVRYNRSDAAMIRVVVPIPGEGGTAAAEQRANQFVTSLFPLLSRHIPA